MAKAREEEEAREAQGGGRDRAPREGRRPPPDFAGDAPSFSDEPADSDRE
jgi:hypothetical protein